MDFEAPHGQTYPVAASRAPDPHMGLGEESRRIPLERAWRRPRKLEWTETDPSWIVASRWIDDRNFSRIEEAVCVPGCHVIGIAMKSARLKLSRGTETVYDGTMAAGTAYVTDASLPITGELHTACDFVHLHIDSRRLEPRSVLDLPNGLGEEREFDGFVTRDPLVERLARSLVEAGDHYGDFYFDSVGQTIVVRLLGQKREQSKVTAPSVSPLPRWRLKRVREFVEDHIDARLGLAEMASAAGLSRMHFAAQFRAATGLRPHDYLLSRRIERAKEMLSQSETPLVEVALSTGFQSQAHFSTVFKRLTGHTPAQWRRENMIAPRLIAGRGGFEKQLAVIGV